MRARALFCLVAAASCGLGDSPEACDFDEKVQAAVGSEPSMDCGAGTLGDPTSYTTAHDCVAAALAANMSFHVTWEVQGIDSQVRFAYIGTAAGTDKLSFDSDPSGGSNIGAVLNRHACSSFVDRNDGAPETSDLGFTCTTGGTFERLCN